MFLTLLKCSEHQNQERAQLVHSWLSALRGVPLSQAGQEDAQLVRASKRGDQEAFALLVRRHQRRIFNLSLDMLTDEDEASECTQEAFVAAWQRLLRFRDVARFSTWLYRIAYQCVLRQFEQRKREYTQTSLGQAEQVVVGTRSKKPEAETAQRQNAQALMREQLERLPLQYRAVLVLRHLHNQTYEEIAAILSISVGAVKTRLFRARALLKVRLAETASLVPQETTVGTPLTENEEVMHLSGQFRFHGRRQDSPPENPETDDFSQSQQAWREQQLGWLEQQRNAVAQQEAWMQQRRGWLEQQQGWLEQRRVWIAEQRGWLEQRRGWLTQQGDRLAQQEAWLIQQEGWLDQQHTTLVQQYSEVVQQHLWVQQRQSWLDLQQRQLTQQDSASSQGDEEGERQSG